MFALPALGLALPALVAATSPQDQLWVVDAAGGPGFDFFDVQPAVDHAGDGDTILVRAGGYGSFTIDGKDLVVTSDAEATPLVQTVTVQNLPAGEEVALRGFRTGPINLLNNDGTVLLESIQAGSVLFPCVAFLLSPGQLVVESCANVVATRCSFVAGGEALEGYDGIHAVGSSLSLYECSAQGGTPTQSGGSPGGDGIEVVDGFLFAAGSSLNGGCGAEGGLCTGGGPGGAGLRRVGGDLPRLLGSVFAGGSGGCPLDWPLCSICGPSGADQVGGFETIAGFARNYELGSPAPAGGATTFVYSGQAGDLVFSLVGFGNTPLFAPELAGVLIVPIPPILVSHGPVDAGGGLSGSIALPGLPPGFEAFTVYAQGAAISGVGAAVLAAPSQLSIL
ncbi:MAG: hypothetical protein AAF682_02760 [Planctomycetota bacterium]